MEFNCCTDMGGGGDGTLHIIESTFSFWNSIPPLEAHEEKRMKLFFSVEQCKYGKWREFFFYFLIEIVECEARHIHLVECEPQTNIEFTDCVDTVDAVAMDTTCWRWLHIKIEINLSTNPHAINLIACGVREPFPIPSLVCTLYNFTQNGIGT